MFYLGYIFLINLFINLFKKFFLFYVDSIKKDVVICTLILFISYFSIYIFPFFILYWYFLKAFLISVSILIYSSVIPIFIFNLLFKLFISPILYFIVNTSSGFFFKTFCSWFIFSRFSLISLIIIHMFILNTCSLWSFILFYQVYNN